MLSLLSADGETWWSDRVRVTAGANPVLVRLEILKLAGTVTVGDRPIPARVGFQGQGGESVTFQADDDGAFGGLLPHSGRWTVELHEETRRLHRVLRNVEVAAHSGEATVTLELPDTRLSGVVVTEAGRPVQALVRASSGTGNEPAVTSRTDANGGFEYTGLPPGEVTLIAQGPDRTSSQPLQVLVPEDGQAVPAVRLVLRETTTLVGRVVSDEGPVARARVMAFALPVSGVSPSRETDSEGHFEISLPSGTQAVSIVVSAGGHVFRMLRRAVRPDEPLIIHLPREGGTLTVELPDALAAQSAVVFHDGAFAGLPLLRFWAIAHGRPPDPQATELEVPAMFPGAYRICIGTRGELQRLLSGAAGETSGGCASGVLSTYGHLRLKLGAKASARSSP